MAKITKPKAVGQQDAVTASQLAAKADLLLSPEPIVAATYNLTKANSSNRIVTGLSAEPQVFTFDTAGMLARDDGGRIMQLGAGAITLDGAAISYSPHLAASPVTNGPNGWVDWEFNGAGITITARSVDQAGVGGTSVDTDYTFSVFGAGQILANDTTEQVLATLPIGGAIGRGRIDVWLTGICAEDDGEIWFRAYLNAVGAPYYLGGDPGPAYGPGNAFNVSALCRAAGVQHVSGDRLRAGRALAVDTSGSNAVIITGQKNAFAVAAAGGNGRAGQLGALQVRVTRLP